ncbi:MAG: RagB/SusD family nutrient uptake outer membrane protein [Capnocytophaga felis]|nr:RagB/SusD family nutrient uptake outer membrane protein [Capnocytophaga felis]
MKKITILVATMLTLSACNRDFLELNPNDRPSSSTFWKTKADYTLALTACYGAMQDTYFSSRLPIWDNLTNNSYDQHSYGGSSNIKQGNITPTNGGFISNIYENAYNHIARVNDFLEKLKGFDGLTDSEKTINEAEVRMIRAHFYSYLFRCYGDVPISDKPLTLETQYQPKKTSDEVYQFIMKDLDFAIANLPSGTYMANPGRWTQDAAKAYKARMILYTAYDQAGNAIASKMTEAQALLNSISGYELAKNFEDNFLNANQEKCPEIMMSVKFLAPNNYTQADVWYGNWVNVAPLANFLNEFEMLDESPVTPVEYTGKGIVNTTLFNKKALAKRDSRLGKTIFIEKYSVNGVEYTSGNPSHTNIGLAKFLDPTAQVPYDYGTQSQQDWVIMRYADVLLMQAEIENELGNTSVAKGYIDQVRKRSSMPELPNGLSQSDMRTRVRRERRIELAFEGLYYFDLKRWKIAKEILNNVKDGLLVYKFEDKHYLWPIPESEIERNKGILVQNPDYKQK